MTALAWIFGLGGLAVAFPFILHLVRQEPKSSTEFSSLMFLRPSPPRLTEKKRLENILLLLLRMLAVALLAFAFMRPLFRSSGAELTEQTAGRDILILLDASASMNRNNVAENVKKVIDDFLNECEASDNIALCAFSEEPRWLVPFADPELPNFELQRSACLKALEGDIFDYTEFEFSSALGYASESLTARNEAASEVQKQQIVLVTDQQLTPNLNGLTSLQWPDNQRLLVLGVTPKSPNAAIVNVSPNPDQADRTDVRISNHGDSGPTNFEYRWISTSAPDTLTVPEVRESSSAFYVANDKTLTLTFPKPAGKVDAIQLLNDTEDFDNVFYFSQPPPQHTHVVYLAAENIDDPNGVPFFLAPCFAGDPRRRVTFSNQFENVDPDSTFIIISRPLSAGELSSIQDLQARGTHVLLLLNDSMPESMFHLSGLEQIGSVSKKPESQLNPNSRDADSKPYSLLVDIDFAHPVWKVFGQPGLNDFSAIQFWKTTAAELNDSARILARFDHGKPAVWEMPSEAKGAGKTLVFATDWRPEISQLALSVKFPILISEILQWGCPLKLTNKSLTVGQPIPLPASDADRYVITPTGERHLVASEAQFFRDTKRPGIYRVTSDDNTETFSVNLSSLESQTRVFDPGQIESLGVALGLHSAESTEVEVLRKKADIDFEGRQKAWKWILSATLLVLLVETVLAARTQNAPARLEE